MDDNLSGEEEDYYYSSDQESLNGIDNDESVSIPVSSRSNTVKVFELNFSRFFFGFC
jgi:ariadne-1